jgi:hypothetical protein
MRKMSNRDRMSKEEKSKNLLLREKKVLDVNMQEDRRL